jgi:single-strand DNA-binding protein
MALYENRITLKGYVGKDAESFATKQQKIFVLFSLCTQSGYKDKQKNEWVSQTEWHRIVVFGTPAGYAKNLKKGDYVEITGALRSSEIDAEIIKDKKKTQVKLHTWEIRASLVKKLAKPQSSREANLDAEPITEDDAA